MGNREKRRREQPRPETWAANRVAREVLGVKLAGLPLPDELVDAAADTDPDALCMQMGVVAAYFADHLARRGGLDLAAEWAQWLALARQAETELRT
jgi:uncharacterized membrane protein (DUF2068 family)